MGGSERRVSVNGGFAPRWHADDKEIYFVRENSLVAVPVSMTQEGKVGIAEFRDRESDN